MGNVSGKARSIKFSEKTLKNLAEFLYEIVKNQQGTSKENNEKKQNKEKN